MVIKPSLRSVVYVTVLVFVFGAVVLGVFNAESKRERRELQKNAEIILEWKINTLDECQKEIISPILRNYKTQKDVVIIMGEEFTHPQDVLSKIFVIADQDITEIWYEESNSFFPRKLGQKQNYNSLVCEEKNKRRPPGIITPDSVWIP